jgi:hypothetical protein
LIILSTGLYLGLKPHRPKIRTRWVISSSEEVFNMLQSLRKKRAVNYESIDLEDELPGARFSKI